MSEELNNDRRLVQSAQKGDRSAYTSLFNRYKDALYYMIFKIVNNEEDAEDLTAETFGRAFKNLNQYDPHYAFSTWLFSIASHHSIDFMRKRKVKLLPIDSAAGSDGELKISEEHIQSDDHNPEEKLIYQQQLQQLKSLLDKLKPEYRQMLELRYFKEYAYWEIAEELDMSIGTVKTKLHRAKLRLADLLEKYFPDEIIE